MNLNLSQVQNLSRRMRLEVKHIKRKQVRKD